MNSDSVFQFFQLDYFYLDEEFDLLGRVHSSSVLRFLKDEILKC